MAKRFTAEVSEFIYEQFDGMSDDSLRAVIADARNLTTTNCGWPEYHLRTVIIEMAQNELRLREEQPGYAESQYQAHVDL